MTAAAPPRAAAAVAPPRPGALFFVAVVLLGANLRVVFSSLPPVLEQVRADLGLSAAAAGLLTTAPVLCFGVLAPLAPALVLRMPVERLLAACAALTAVGAAARGLGGAAGLFGGTVLAGAAVAVGQTAVPTLLRVRFPDHRGALTGAFSMALPLGAAFAAGTVVPIGGALGDSWRAGLAAFGVPAALAAVLWLTRASGGSTVIARSPPFGLRRLLRSWSLAGYFGAQSAAFYCGLTWLPSILEDEGGFGAAEAGGLLALANVVQLAPALLVPMLATRRREQGPILLALVALAASGFLGLLLAPELGALWMVAIGIGQGGSLGLALVLPVVRGANAAAVAVLTAITLSAGYLLASAGPALIGLAHDATDGWTLPLALLVALTLVQLVPGLPATRAWTIGERELDA